MNWFKKAQVKMKLDWDTAYKELLKELRRIPTSEEVRIRMQEASPFDHQFPIDTTEEGYKDLPF